MQDQRDDLEWREGVPVSRRFADPYYSLEDGLAETRHVFLAGNGLPGRFTDDFRIAELGFGTGLNFLVTLAAWREAGAPGQLEFTTFEAFPLSAAERMRALSVFPQLGALAAELSDAPEQILEGNVVLRILPGDARDTLPRWDGRADAWFLDGFAPSRNPELWERELLAEVARHTAPGGTAATYTAAGEVRRALAAAGFEVERMAGYGRKRHMTRARLREA